jgi:hypothetical protein
MTMELEIAVWQTLLDLCEANLREYSVPLADDEKNLCVKDLSENMRNILIVRSGEKRLN